MDIGNKLKQARTKANLTQEQVAEALGVSRQTISNWENEKTYPDIRSVVTLSNLYDVSLDYLLKDKEETSMAKYLDYLEESTNTVNSKNKLSQLILVITYLLIWSFSLIVFWFFISGSDTLGFSLIFLWILIPVTTFIISILIGKNNYWSKGKWLMPLAFGVMHTLAEYATFSTANMVNISFERINKPHFELIFVSVIISAVGLGIGSLIFRIKSKHAKNQSYQNG